MSARVILGAAMLGGLACTKRPSAEPPGEGPPAAPAADSLVATAPGGAEIWFTLARTDSGDGGPCVDRGIEIRRGGTTAAGAAPVYRDGPRAGGRYHHSRPPLDALPSSGTPTSWT